jgi:hypothetical protein
MKVEIALSPNPRNKCGAAPSRKRRGGIGLLISYGEKLDHCLNYFLAYGKNLTHLLPPPPFTQSCPGKIARAWLLSSIREGFVA